MAFSVKSKQNWTIIKSIVLLKMFVVALQVLFKTMSCTSLLLDELNSSTCKKKEEKYLFKITFSEKWKAILIKKSSYSEKTDLQGYCKPSFENLCRK